jgi:hypothetical protein
LWYHEVRVYVCLNVCFLIYGYFRVVTETFSLLILCVSCNVLYVNPSFHFYFPAAFDTSMASERTFDVETTLVTVNIRSGVAMCLRKYIQRLLR